MSKLTRDVSHDLDTGNYWYSKMCRRLGIASYLHTLQHRTYLKIAGWPLGVTSMRM
ncbi:MAG: hypothetical protein LC700_01110 [Actinobacteria bacterium]|nr:hypothetical protein [Actinomycetota bacterium]